MKNEIVKSKKNRLKYSDLLKKLPESYHINNTYVSTLLNVTTVGVFIVPKFLAEGITLSNWTYYVAVYVIFDVLCISFDMLSLLYWYKIRIFFKRIKYRKSIRSNMSLEQLKNTFSDLRSYRHYDIATNEMMLEELGNVIEDYQEQEKQLESSESAANFYTRNIMFVKEMAQQFKEYQCNVEWINKAYHKIASKTEYILKQVEEDESSVELIISSYNVYAKELISITKQYVEMNKADKDLNSAKMHEIINAFQNHLNNIDDRVSNYKKHKFDMDIDFLSEKLEESNNK